MAKKILIVEDETLIAGSIVDFLKKKGYDAVSAGSGDAALEELANGKPDLILLDIVMPRMDGITLLKQLQHPDCDCRNIPIIIFSNVPGKKKWIEDMGLRVEDYLIKAKTPLPELENKIKNILGS